MVLSCNNHAASHSIYRSIMVWTESKDLSLLRTIAAEGIFVNTKAGSRERGAAWLNVASALAAESLTVTARSVRDRYNILARKWKAKVGAEEKESGGGEKHMTEVEVLLEELVELESESEKVAEQQNEEKKAAAEKEKKQATEMRQRALERFGETRKRQTETEKEEGKKETKRRSGGGALEWLKEKGESLRELKEKELQDKKQEREIQKMQHEQFVGQLQATQVANNEQMKMFQQQMLQQMQQQQHQQQQQQQQFTMLQHQMMVMMQQHAQLMSNLLKKDE